MNNEDPQAEEANHSRGNMTRQRLGVDALTKQWTSMREESQKKIDVSTVFTKIEI